MILIPPEGPKDAKIVIVGEAPGVQEVSAGRPFVGASGKLLMRLLASEGISRSECYITNVVKERPPGNIVLRLGAEKVRKYTEALITELSVLSPNVILACGNTSLKALTDKNGIMKWRGSILESTTLPGRKVIPTIHPASALRVYVNQYLIKYDIGKLAREQQYPEIRLKERNLILKPTFQEIFSFLNICKQKPIVAFDIEVSGEEMSCISFAHDSSTAISIPFTEGRNHYFPPEQEMEVIREIAYILEDEKIEKLTQNGMFDASFLLRKYGIHVRPIHDTMIAQAILYPDLPKDLGTITSLYTDIPYYKDEGRKIGGNYHGNEQFWGYNAKDSIVLIEAFEALTRGLEKAKNLETYNSQRGLIPALLAMTEFGIRMDTEGLSRISKRVERELEELEIRLREIVGYNINPRSPKQLKEYFYDHLNIKPYLHKGRPTTNEGALKRLSRRGYKAATILMDIRKRGKLKGTYFDMALDPDRRLRSSINPVGTVTGRVSSSKTIFGTGANIQNQPPIMKRFMLVESNHVGYELDLAQAENRVVAYIAPDHDMIEAFEANIDIHSQTASRIFGGPHTKEYQDSIKASIGTGEYTQRYWGKKANHAFNYMQGHQAFSYQCEVPESEGKQIRDSYIRAYPGVPKYWSWVQTQLNKTRTITNPFGRRRIFLDRWSDNLIRDAVAFIPQSTVADKIKYTLIFLNDNPLDIFQQVIITMTIHDSIYIQIPYSLGWNNHAHILQSIINKMQEPITWMRKQFSIPADLKIFVRNFKDSRKIDHRTGDLALILKDNYSQLL